MVTAVEPAFGLLRRLHLHSMETALNELSSQNSILHSLRFSAHPFLFKRHPRSEDVRKEHCHPNQKRPASCVSDTDLKSSKRLRRPVSNQCTHSVTARSKSDNPDVSNNRVSPLLLRSTNTSASTPSSPPVLHPAISPHNRRTPNYFSDPPVLSDAKPRISNSHISHTANQPRQIIDSVHTSGYVYSNLRTSSCKNGLHTDENIPHGVRPVTSPSVISSLRNLKNFNEDVTKTPISIQTRSRYSTRSSVHIFNDRSGISSTSKDTSKNINKDAASKEYTKPGAPLKRRRSFDRLTEPSIHGLPDPEIKPRSRRPTQLLQSKPIASSTSIENNRGSAYLTVDSSYYLPDFCSLNSIRESRTPNYNINQPKVDNSQALIEVPKWRVVPISSIINSFQPTIDSKRSVMKVSSTNTMNASSGRLLRSTETSRSTSRSRSRHRSCSGQSQRSVPTETYNQDIEEEEDMTDAAYSSRHARLEVEEVRRERLARQRTAELELKHRLELRDQASWHKRQPGRLEPILKFKPETRIPNTLNYPFTKATRFHLEDKIPLIVFGSRVPIKNLKSFARIRS